MTSITHERASDRCAEALLIEEKKLNLKYDVVVMVQGDEPLVVGMIETKPGLKNIREILSVKGLDAILIGPYDLSASLGLTGETSHPKVEKEINHILSCCIKLNIPAGIHIVNASVKEFKNKIKKGYRFIAYSIDTVFLNLNCKNPVEEL